MLAAHRRLPIALIGAATLGLFGDALAVQDPRKSEIRGTVIRANDRVPMSGARVSLDGTELTLTTDDKGRFKFPKVAAGQYIIRAEVEGFPVATSTLLLAQGDRLDVEFLVGATESVMLPELKVTADAPRISPVAEFNRRATSGNGRYFHRDYIEKRRAANLMDLLRGTPGMRVECPRNERTGCRLRMSRSPRNCGPGYFLDGIPSDPSVLFLTSPNDVEGIEVYSGPSETPPELEGVRSQCGAVAIWTRVGRRPGG
ncbi:MAG TPA: carboxypeptidase regulatory-like domain-containing protein [Gemmatimonadales bacterium]